MMVFAQKIAAPEIDWSALAPLVALGAGACLVLMVGLLRSRSVRTGLVPFLTIVTLGATIGLAVEQWGQNVSIIEGALAMDDLTRFLLVLFCAGGIAAVLLARGSTAAEEAGHGEFHCLLLSSVLGMVVLAGATNLVTLFLGFELLSIPLYVLCATEMRRATSLESGLKYLIVGSAGSATLLYGLALVYGASGATDYDAIAAGIDRLNNSQDVLFLVGVGLVLVGLAFKASVAPFHQWTPDVYEGAPTPVTAFMAVATKAAAFGVLLRLFDVALIGGAADWAPLMAVLAAITIAVGNVGALGQTSLKRMLAFSSVAQAGYLLAGVVVTTQLGIQATVFYLAAYLVMNLAAFAVIVVRERQDPELGDDIASLNDLGATQPWLAWPMTLAMLGLAGLPATAGFFGKIQLIEASVDNGYAWLGVAIVLGSALSLAYYLRVVAAVWTREDPSVALTPAGRPVMAGGAPGADEPAPIEDPHVTSHGDDERTPAGGVRPRDDVSATGQLEDEPGPGDRRGRHLEAVFVAVLCGVATVALGIYPGPLFDAAQDAGQAISSLL